MPIDWNGTGSMLSGWATLAGAGAIIYAAKVGANTFDSWKRQKQEERRMDVAERILTLAYKLKYNFQSVRAPLIEGHELEAAEKLLSEQQPEWWGGLDDAGQKRARTGQAVFNRLKRHNHDWEQIWELKPLALAYFSPKVEVELDKFWQQYVAVQVAAEAYAHDGGDDKEFAAQLRQDLWRLGEGGRVGRVIDGAVTALEIELRPVITEQQSNA